MEEEKQQAEQLQLYKKLQEDLARKFRYAELLAETYGQIIGEVNILEPTIFSAEKRRRSIECVIDLRKLLKPDGQGGYEVDGDLVKWTCSLGSYLACIDIKTQETVGLKITEVKRESTSTIMGNLKTSLIPKKDVSELVTPIKVSVEPTLSVTIREGRAVGQPKSTMYVVEPKSPVFIPDPWVLKMLLGIPEDGVTIGALSNADAPLLLMGACEVKLSKKCLFQHTLIVGTTGAGKTTEVKNLIYELVKRHGASVLALDPTQELVQMLFPARKEELDEEYPGLRSSLYGVDADKLTKAIVLLPMTAKKAQEIGDTDELLIENYYNEVIKPLVERHQNEIVVDPHPNEGVLKWAYRKESGEEECSLTVLPYAFKFESEPAKLGKKLVRLNPFFTERAKVALPIILREVWDEEVRDLGKLAQRLDGRFYSLVSEKHLVARSTLENIIRNIRALDEWGLFGVKVGGEEISEAAPDEYIEGGYLTIVDLRYAMEDVYSQCAFTFHILDKVFAWKREKRVRGEETPDLFIVADEAHNYFPQRGLLEEESVRVIAGKLQRIAREGRKERLGLILATQFPRDVHDVVRSLCNTKIVFRVDRSDLEALDIPWELRELATKMQNLTGIVKSPVGLRTGYLTIKVPLPITEHVDLSAARS